ncbi:MAG: hypothetical protein Q9218_005931 [Villophora microphyllina]
MGDGPLKELGFPEYWDKRYGDLSEGGHEWFRTFEKLHPFLERQLPDPRIGARIIHLGCGDSTLPADLLNLNHTNQLSVDFSEVVIEQMRSKHPDLEWRVEDGTLDAMLYGSQWDPPDEVQENVRQYVDEVTRILKPTGKWIYITFRQPHFVKPQLLREGSWDLAVERLEDGPGTFEYFTYIMTKHEQAR